MPHKLLKEARHWMKFAVAAYYAQDATAARSALATEIHALSGYDDLVGAA